MHQETNILYGFCGECGAKYACPLRLAELLAADFCVEGKTSATFTAGCEQVKAAILCCFKDMELFNLFSEAA